MHIDKKWVFFPLPRDFIKHTFVLTMNYWGVFIRN